MEDPFRDLGVGQTDNRACGRHDRDLLIVGTPLAWWLARSKTIWSEAVATIVVLPPIPPQPVLGFYLLALLGPGGAGSLIASLWGERTLAITFAGLVVGSVLSALPLVVQPIRNAFLAMGDRPLEVAATLRASPSYAFFTVALPLARPAFLTAAVLGFAHTIGAFGIVLMIGGNIPGHTKYCPAFYSTISKHHAGTRQTGLLSACWCSPLRSSRS